MKTALQMLLEIVCGCLIWIVLCSARGKEFDIIGVIIQCVLYIILLHWLRYKIG